jgi:F-type H+-transporting ATPase subunit c
MIDIAQAAASAGSGQIAIGIGLGVGIGALGAGVGLGLIGGSGVSAMARQPEAISKIQTAMLIALAFVELVFLLTWILFLGVRDKLPGTPKIEVKQASLSSKPVAIEQNGVVTLNLG